MNIKWKDSTEKDFRRIDPQYIPGIIREAEGLAKNPYPHGARKLRDSTRSYRIRAGDYRVIYTVNSQQKTVFIESVRHRKDAYRRR